MKYRLLAIAFPGMLLAQNFSVGTTQFSLDIAAATTDFKKTTGGCANYAYTQDAKIWSLLAYAIPGPTANAARTSEILQLYSVPGQGGVFMIRTEVTPTQVSVSAAGQEFKGNVVGRGAIAVLEFEPQTLADVGTLVDRLTSDTTFLPAQFANAVPSGAVTVYRLYDASDTNRIPTEVEVQRALEKFPGTSRSASLGAMLQALLAKGPPATDKWPETMRAEKITAAGVPNFATLSMDPASVGKIKEDLKMLATFGRPSTTTRAPAGQPLTASEGESAGQPPIFLIDEPCLQVNITPVLSGSKDFTTAASFKARYDIFSADGNNFLRLRAEGNTAQSGSYFQRLQASSDAGYQKKAKGSLHGLAVALGGGLGYSLSREADKKKEEWNGVGKIRLFLPQIGLSLLPGANTAPNLVAEIGAVGGDNGTRKDTDFLAKGSFQYTSRVTERLSFDVSFTAGASNQARFASRKNFNYTHFQSRFALGKAGAQWDYVVRYECGRQTPDYRHYCGWLSGIASGLGR